MPPSLFLPLPKKELAFRLILKDLAPAYGQIAMTQSLLDQFDCDTPQLTRLLGDALSGSDDGELFVENVRKRKSPL